VAGARAGGSALFVSGGIGAVRMGEPRGFPAPDCGAGPECLDTPGSGETFGQMRPALHLGVGGRAALVAHLGVRADVRVHAWSAEGADEGERIRPPRFEVALGLVSGF
jgi:hypothetical protein